jgi:hypothetical protein
MRPLLMSTANKALRLVLGPQCASTLSVSTGPLVRVVPTEPDGAFLKVLGLCK